MCIVVVVVAQLAKDYFDLFVDAPVAWCVDLALVRVRRLVVVVHHQTRTRKSSRLR